MNKKLFGYEINQTKKLSIILIGLLAVYALISLLWNMITPLHKLIDNVAFSVIVLCISLCMIAVLGIYILGRYYKVLFGKTSSLTMTIPVPNKSHLNNNLLVGIMWLLVALVVFIIGLIFTDIAAGRNNEIYGILLFLDIRNWIEYSNDNSIVQAISLGLVNVICPIIVIANIYVSGLTILSITKLLSRKFGVGETNKIIIAASIVTMAIKIFALSGIIEVVYRLSSLVENPFIWDISEILALDVCYSISAVIMYIFCKWVVTKKYES